MKIAYNPAAVKEVTVWEPVAVTVADEISHQLWQEHPMMRNDPNRDRHSPRWRREGIEYGKGKYDSKVFRSGVLFDNKEEALAWLEANMVPEYLAKVEAGTYTPCAGKTKPGFAKVRKTAGADPERYDPDFSWHTYFNFVVSGKVDTRNSYAWKKRQYTWKEVDAFALRVEKRKIHVPAE